MSEISPAKLAANRRNAQKSTGPQSDVGKARSSRNALKHGLTARTWTLLPDEDAAEYAALQDALTQELAPETTIERVLVGRIGQLVWRLHRAGRLEQLLMEYELDSAGSDIAFYALGGTKFGIATLRLVRNLPTLSRYEQGLERSLYRAMRELERVQAKRTAAGTLAAGSPAE